MKQQSFQYAQLPQFKYQSFERQYQTFDRNTLQFSYYPTYTVDPLTAGKDQVNNEPSAYEPEKGPAPDEPVAEPSSSPDESSATPDPAGMCNPLIDKWLRYHEKKGGGWNIADTH